MAADVYSVAPHVGRGGWTWYTGSAGWMYRAGIEGILGLRREGAALVVAPCIPRAWPGFEAEVKVGSTRYDIRVETSAHRARPRMRLSTAFGSMRQTGCGSRWTANPTRWRWPWASTGRGCPVFGLMEGFEDAAEAEGGRASRRAERLCCQRAEQGVADRVGQSRRPECPAAVKAQRTEKTWAIIAASTAAGCSREAGSPGTATLLGHAPAGQTLSTPFLTESLALPSAC